MTIRISSLKKEVEAKFFTPKCSSTIANNLCVMFQYPQVKFGVVLAVEPTCLVRCCGETVHM